MAASASWATFGPAEQPPDVPADVILRTGHSGVVTALAFSPDGRLLATASISGEVLLWNPQEGTEEARLSEQYARVRSIVFSPDGRLLAAGSEDGFIRIWDVEKRLLIHTLSGSGDPAVYLAISQDTKYLISAGEAHPVRLWDLTSGGEIAVLDRHAYGVTAVYFTPKGNAAVACTMGDTEQRGTLKIFDVPGGENIATTETLVRAATPDGRWTAVQHGQWQQASIGIVNAEGEEIARFAGSILPVVFNPGGEWVAHIEYPRSSIVVHKVPASEPVAVIRGENWEFEDLAISADGSLVATCGRRGIKLWSLPQGELLKSFKSQPGSSSFVWTAGGQTIVTAGTEILDWDVASGKPSLGPAFTGTVLGAALSPDENLLLVGGKSLRLLHRRTGELVREFEGPCDVMPSPAFSPDGALAAANCRGIVTVWEVATGQERFRAGIYNLPDSGIAAFSPDGRFVLASAGPGHVILHPWNGAGVEKQFAVSGTLSSVSFSPDMRLLALGTRSQMRVEQAGDAGPRMQPVAGQRAVIAVFDLATGRRIFSVDAGDWVTALAFSQRNETLLAAFGPWNQPGQVQELDTLSGRIIRTVVAAVDANGGAAFSPDRNWLAACSSFPQGSIKLWKIE